jgi:phage terminase Nu1 subunit (DNA packaging protein)
MDPVSTRDLAQLLGVTSKTIALWAKTGVVVRTAHGKFDLGLSVQGFARHMRSLVGAKGGETAATAVAVERAALLHAQRMRIEREAAKEGGQLINAAEFQEAMTVTCRGLRVHLMSIPQRISGRAPHLDRQDIGLIDDEVRAALTEVSEMSLGQLREVALGAKELAPTASST